MTSRNFWQFWPLLFPLSRDLLRCPLYWRRIIVEPSHLRLWRHLWSIPKWNLCNLITLSGRGGNVETKAMRLSKNFGLSTFPVFRTLWDFWRSKIFQKLYLLLTVETETETETTINFETFDRYQKCWKYSYNELIMFSYEIWNRICQRETTSLECSVKRIKVINFFCITFFDFLFHLDHSLSLSSITHTLSLSLSFSLSVFHTFLH